MTIDKPVSIVQKMEGEDYKLTASEVRERLERISDEDAFVSVSYTHLDVYKRQILTFLAGGIIY